mmetsp:Transcript_3155/g.7477  ORF Transcript_3155/g.7477 Transcript_3155/m.7477 type:complete len:265 (-) Transcript_3155:194-988(-)
MHRRHLVTSITPEIALAEFHTGVIPVFAHHSTTGPTGSPLLLITHATTKWPVTFTFSSVRSSLREACSVVRNALVTKSAKPRSSAPGEIALASEAARTLRTPTSLCSAICSSCARIRLARWGSNSEPRSPSSAMEVSLAASSPLIDASFFRNADVRVKPCDAGGALSSSEVHKLSYSSSTSSSPRASAAAFELPIGDEGSRNLKLEPGGGGRDAGGAERLLLLLPAIAASSLARANWSCEDDFDPPPRNIGALKAGEGRCGCKL